MAVEDAVEDAVDGRKWVGGKEGRRDVEERE